MVVAAVRPRRWVSSVTKSNAYQSGIRPTGFNVRQLVVDVEEKSSLTSSATVIPLILKTTDREPGIRQGPLSRDGPAVESESSQCRSALAADR